MNREQLIEQITKKKTFLCVGLDPDTHKLPPHLIEEEDDPIFAFNKAIVDSTAEYCIAFKPNTAFYEAYGINGMEALEKTIRYIKINYPDHLLIADAKRGDIGNTSTMYAHAFFDKLGADAITVAPYMGSDSVKPFLDFNGKWTIVLGLTSNSGSADFQMKKIGDTELYKEVIRTVATWGTKENMMFVVGATKASLFEEVRKIIPEHFLLVPGIGAQGGDLHEVCKHGLNKGTGLIINSSRAIIYASNKKDFAHRAGEEAKKTKEEMNTYFK